jgi:hypothetical protein
MSSQLSRGTKRVCQSAMCALPFYDLNRVDISCPNCGTIFDASIALYPRSDQSAAMPWKRVSRGTHAFATQSKPPPARLDEDAASASTSDAIIDADSDTLAFEDDTDVEIAEVVIQPEGDQANR